MERDIPGISICDFSTFEFTKNVSSFLSRLFRVRSLVCYTLNVHIF